MPASRTSLRLEIQEGIPLAPYTTIGVGGPARFFTRVRDEAQLVEALHFASEDRLPVLILGGGSNLLVRDGGFSGLVLHLNLEAETSFTVVGDHVHVHAAAGTGWDSLVDAVNAHGLSGMECLAGIPGLTGGTPIQNVGAYGQEVSEIIAAVRALDRTTGRFVEIAAADCGFAYRSSRFNGPDRDRFVITAVDFRLSRTAQPSLRYADLERRFGSAKPSPSEVSAVVREIRRGKGMLLSPDDPDCRSAGSFFKNPIVPLESLRRVASEADLPIGDVPHWPAEQGRVKLAAAWLLERAGFHRGFLAGQVGISSKHTLALINCGHATFADLAALRDRIRATVRDRFGIILEQEPVEVGDQV